MNIAECKTIIPNQDNYDDNDNHDEHIHPNHDLGYVPGDDLNNHIYHNLYPGFDSGEDHDDYNKSSYFRVKLKRIKFEPILNQTWTRPDLTLTASSLPSPV